MHVPGPQISPHGLRADNKQNRVFARPSSWLSHEITDGLITAS